jgi:hypothetical protein
MSLKAFGDRSRADRRKQRATKGPTVPVDILGREVEFAFPTTAQRVYLATQMESSLTDDRLIGSMINFFLSLTDDDSARYIRNLLLDPESGFEAIDITGGSYEEPTDEDDPDGEVEEVEVDGILPYLLEQWHELGEGDTDRPTRRRSTSGGSPSRTGTSSTANSRRAGSTRSTSRTAGS